MERIGTQTGLQKGAVNRLANKSCHLFSLEGPGISYVEAETISGKHMVRK